MSGLTNTARDAILNWVALGNSGEFLPPKNLTVGLFLEDPTPGNVGVEVSTENTGYQRMSMSFIPGLNPGSVRNGSAIIYPQATSNWGIVKFVGVFGVIDDTNVEQLLFYTNLISPTEVPVGAVTSFNPGNLEISLV